MAVVKNMMVRVGVDFSGLISKTKPAAAAAKSWANQTSAAFRQVGSSASGLNAAENRLTRFSGVLKTVGKAAASFFAVRQLVNFGKECLSAASDLAEVQNVVDVVFPNMAGQVNEFTQLAAGSFGLSETMAKKFTGTYGAMAKAFGFSEQAAYDMSTTLTGLAGDVASFYNISQDLAYTKLKSVFSGETETLKELGIVMTQNALDAYALANGYGKTTSAMTEMEKVALRYSFVQDQLSAAAGDFARTSDGWANQVRLLSLNFQSLKAVIGSGLIAVLKPFLRGLNTALSGLVKFGNAVSSVFHSVFGTKETAISGAVIEDVQDYSTGLDNVASSAGGASAAAKELKRQLMGFDEINKLSATSGGSDGGGGGSGGAVSGGGTGILDDAAEKTTKWSETMQKFHDWLSGLNFTPIQTAWENLKTAGQNLADVIAGGLKWGLKNVLAPLGKWTIEEGLPATIQMVAFGLNAVADALAIMGPPLEWCWENVVKPFIKAVGDKFVGTVKTVSGILMLIDGYLKDIRSYMDGEKKLSDLFDPGDSGGKLITLVGLGKSLYENVSSLFGLRPKNGVYLPVQFKNQNTADELWKNFQKGWNAVKQRTVIIGNELKEDASSLWKKLKDGWGTASGHVVQIWNNLVNSAATLWQGFHSSWGAASGRVVQIWNGLVNTASTLWQRFRDGWGSRAVSIGNNLVNTASTLWQRFRDGWGSRAVSIGNSLVSSAYTLWQNFKAGWGSRGVSIVNSLTNSAAKLWADFKAGWSGKKLGLTITYDTNVGSIKRAVYRALGLSGWPTIRFAARGGIVQSAALFGNTVIGEAGREAIVPLENHTEWLDRVGDRLAQRLSAGGPTGEDAPIIVQVTLNGRVLGQTVVDYINDRTRTSGNSPIIL